MPAGVGRTPALERSNRRTPSVRSSAAICWEMPDWVAFSRSAARVNDPSSQTATTARTWRRLISGINKPDDLAQNILFRMEAGSSYIFRNKDSWWETAAAHRRPLWGIAMANAGIVGLDW